MEASQLQPPSLGRGVQVTPPLPPSMTFTHSEPSHPFLRMYAGQPLTPCQYLKSGNMSSLLGEPLTPFSLGPEPKKVNGSSGLLWRKSPHLYYSWPGSIFTYCCILNTASKKMKVAQYFEYSGKAPNLILFFHKIRFLKIDQLLALM